MKTVRDLIKELQEFHPDLPVYHHDLRSLYSWPKLNMEQTVVEGEPYKYLVLSSEEQTEEQKEITESDIFE